MTEAAIRLRPIAAISPTLAEVARMCLLRAGLSRCPEAQRYVLGNPKAWLGTAYHEVMAKLPCNQSNESDSVDALVDEIWGTAVSHLEAEAAAHPLNRRFGNAKSWPAYYVVHEMAHLRARYLASTLPSLPASPEAIYELSTAEPVSKLRGLPDLVRGDEIIDFKTGNIYEDACEGDPAGNARDIRAAYIRQLRIYAYLIHASTGRWCRRGTLVPLAGPPVTVELQKSQCEAEAEEAVQLLDAYNNALSQAASPLELAAPSPESCRWCPYKIMCPAIWTAAIESWQGMLDGECASGPLIGSPQPLHIGAAVRATLSVHAGTLPRTTLDLAPLSTSIHFSASQGIAGEELRTAGLIRRSDGRVVTSIRTVILLESDIPAVELPL